MTKIGTVFSELLKLAPRFQFDQAVERRDGDRYAKSFTAWRQFITLMYAQITGKDSLREIETGLAAQSSRLYHLGLESVRRSTLADANNRRDWRIFEELFYKILERCQSLTPRHKFRFKNPLYSMDATVIDLCLSMFPWAKFRKTKGAIKLHCLYDHSGAMPSFMVVTDGKKHETKVVKEHSLPLPPDSIISVDRGYLDFKWLYSLTVRGVYFVTRAKDNFRYDVAGQHLAPSGKGVIKDEKASLAGFYQEEDYPDEIRRIEYFDEESGKTLVFLTNNFWVKQNLKIKSFLGTSVNAVMSQIWVAMRYYLLLVYIKYQSKYAGGLLELSRVIRETLMNRMSLIDILTAKPERLRRLETEPAQMTIF